MDQINIFDLTMTEIKIKNKIRLIELFAGYGSHAMALDVIGADYEHHKISEWEVNANRSYKAVHKPDDNVAYSDKIEKWKWVSRILYERGISVDGKTGLSLKEIKKRGEKWCRQTYNEFTQCNNLGSVTNIQGADLEITETDKYTYFLTYSFPCQSLSLAGKQEGMKKGSGTRSGLLWEVERILSEIKAAGGELPQILFMENVPQVMAKANISDFHDWQQFLEGFGYKNYVKMLNARDYETAQNRNRCFMFSFLGDYNYKFPEPIALTRTIGDYLEDTVDEKYYIDTEKTRKLIKLLVKNDLSEGNHCIDLAINDPRERRVANCLTTKDYGVSNKKQIGNGVLEIKQIGNIGADGLRPTLMSMTGRNRQPMIVTVSDRDCDNLVMDGNFNQRGIVHRERGICRTILGCAEPKVLIKQTTEKGYIECAMGGVADLSFPNSKTRRGRVHEGGSVSPTLTASGSGNICRFESMYRIRKLTPRECGRLMAVPEKQIDSILDTASDTQARKQFGNSIVVSVMVAMFSNLNIQGLPAWSKKKDRKEE